MGNFKNIWIVEIWLSGEKGRNEMFAKDFLLME